MIATNIPEWNQTSLEVLYSVNTRNVSQLEILTNSTKQEVLRNHTSTAFIPKNISCMSGLCNRSLWFNDSIITQSDTDSSNHTMEESSIIQDQYNWAVLFLTPLIVFGVAGNILVCMAISMEKRLQNVTNYFLLSLAVTDLLLCIIVMPFSIINEFTGKKQWTQKHTVCFIIKIFITSWRPNQRALIETKFIIFTAFIILYIYTFHTHPFQNCDTVKNQLG